MAFVVEVPVRFRDIDGMGHVNNAVYFTYLETARGEFYRQKIGIKSIEEIGFILAHASCDFKAPIQYGEIVVVTLRVADVGDSSFEFRYELRGKDGTLFATARSVQVSYDYDAKKPKPIPPKTRKHFEEEMAES